MESFSHERDRHFICHYWGNFPQRFLGSEEQQAPHRNLGSANGTYLCHQFCGHLFSLYGSSLSVWFWWWDVGNNITTQNYVAYSSNKMSIVIQDYTDDEIIVHGRGTFMIRGALKELGGRWRPLKQRRPGMPAKAWVLNKSAKSKVEQLVKKAAKSKKKPKKPKKPKKKAVKPKKKAATPKESKEDFFEKCVHQTAFRLGMTPEEVRAIVFEAYPQYHPQFGALPDELVIGIILEMNPYMVPTFCATSRRMSGICQSDNLWQRLWEKHFSARTKQDWGEWMKREQKTYKETFLHLLKEGGKLARDYYGEGDPKKIHIKGLGDFSYNSWFDMGRFFEYVPERKELIVPIGVVSVTCIRLGLRSVRLPHTLIRLVCWGNEIDHLEIPDSLHTLKCHRNQLKGLLDLKNVRIADLGQNQVTKLKFNKSHFKVVDDFYEGKRRRKVGLESLNVYGNKIERLDLRKSNMHFLQVGDNGMKELLLPRATNLTSIDVVNNDLKILVLPKAVDDLRCIGNPWERIYVPSTKSLKARVKKALVHCAQSENLVYYKGPMPDPAKIYRERRLLELIPRGEDILQTMPSEVIVEIMKHLAFFDIKRLCKASKTLLAFCKNDLLWSMLVRRDFNLRKEPEMYGYGTYMELYHELAKNPGEWKRVKIGNLFINYVGQTIPAKGWDYRPGVSGSLGSIEVPKGVVAIRSYLLPALRGSSDDLRVILEDRVYLEKFKSLGKLQSRVKNWKVVRGQKLVLLTSEEGLLDLPARFTSDLVESRGLFTIQPQDKIGIQRSRVSDVDLYIPFSFFGIRYEVIPEKV